MLSFHGTALAYPWADITLDKPKGERTNLVKVRKILDREFEQLSEEKIAELKIRAGKEQHTKLNVPKQVKRAQQHDVTKVAQDIQNAVSAAKNSKFYITWQY